MTSPARSAAARLNGSKSRGPKTRAGKARSCRNATSHGLLSRNPLPHSNSDESFHRGFAELLHKFPNPDRIALGFIHQAAAARSRIAALNLMEKQWMDELIAAQPAALHPIVAIANAFAILAGTNKFKILGRQQGRAFRDYFNAVRTLLKRLDSKNHETNPTRRTAQTRRTASPAATGQEFRQNDPGFPKKPAEITPDFLKFIRSRPRHRHRPPPQTRGRPDPA